MIFSVSHWLNQEIKFPGIYQQGTSNDKSRKLYWLKIPEKDLGKTLLELMKNFDIKILAPEVPSKYTIPEPFTGFPKLVLDVKGGNFVNR